MKHPEKRKARGYDTYGMCRGFIDRVYCGDIDTKANLWDQMNASVQSFEPEAPDLNVYIGEVHGHSNLSDGSVEPEYYYEQLRDTAKVDFAALTDHDHGGVGGLEIWADNFAKWNKMREMAKKYYEPHKFTTILAYERDSYPYMNNMILYFNNHDAEPYRGVRDGEITYDELMKLKQRDDVLYIPHDTYDLAAGTDFETLPFELMPNNLEIFSRGDAAEYMGNPAFDNPTACPTGFWRTALERGAKMGVIAGSDDHIGFNGITTTWDYPYNYPGLTGVWAKDNTLEDIFDAIKKRRTFAFMGGRVSIDFRINGHYMGEEITLKKDEDAHIYFNITTDEDIKRITLIKNARDYIVFNKDTKQTPLYKTAKQSFIDYKQERETDYYYIRVAFGEDRFAWSSPIWITRK